MPYQTSQIDNWNQVEEFIDEYRSDLERQFRGMDVRLLFRGQSSAQWNLETTLLRTVGAPVSMKKYDDLLHRICPAIQSLTDSQWALSRDGFKGVEDEHRPFYIPNYEFMAYSRHHGFPTPLLDWTKSPYVALFFAFQDASADEDVALFVYLDEFRIGSAGWVGSQRVLSQGEYIAPHRRHFTQQSVYTTCTMMLDQTWVYASHQEYFDQPRDRTLIAKLTIPGEMRSTFLEKLDQMNINAFSLFSNEEGLMQMLWNREGKGMHRLFDVARVVPLQDDDDET